MLEARSLKFQEDRKDRTPSCPEACLFIPWQVMSDIGTHSIVVMVADLIASNCWG
jgi:hypothetical protein